ncbi:MAG: UDP-N-acetylglucosamine 1-carboxyvinyltransferase [Firmicutes bacterium]|nr:UDP-N-acetylglucosamine 1-carboxyvinyltransferase [Bacillota bacterium]
MKELVIHGGKPLTGTIRISGAKNSAVALVPASLLSDEGITIDNVPNITDIDALDEILVYLGATVKREGTKMEIVTSNIENKEIPEQISKKLRASYYFMGALLGKYKRVEMYFPGGCAIGKRPIDLHLKAFEALGATVTATDNKYLIEAEELIGTDIYLDKASVGATINIMLASVKAKGITKIQNAAREPEIVNVATLLNNMGAEIEGAGTSEIKITGVKHLGKSFIEVIPDRIEAGTYIILASLLGNPLTIDNIIPNHVESLLSKLKEMGVNYQLNNSSVTIQKTYKLKPITVKTECYPGFPTDLQQPITTLLNFAQGDSKVQETIYENRFQNVPYLNELGCDIDINGDTLTIHGSKELHGKTVSATDLRAGACLFLAGLKADGVTVIENVEYVLRGYENIIEKLTSVGAKIELKEI